MNDKDPGLSSKIPAEDDLLSRMRQEGEAAPPASGRQEIPPADFPMLLSLLASNALAAMGQFPHLTGGTPKIDLPQARHFIDLLQILEQKTKGNLAQHEAGLLEQLLYELRLGYLEAEKKAPK